MIGISGLLVIIAVCVLLWVFFIRQPKVKKESARIERLKDVREELQLAIINLKDYNAEDDEAKFIQKDIDRLKKELAELEGGTKETKENQ